jgi:hypothetical protein
VIARDRNVIARDLRTMQAALLAQKNELILNDLKRSHGQE